MHKCVYSLLHVSRSSSVSHMPRYIRHPAGPTSDVTNCIHICDRGACVAYISIYTLYIYYLRTYTSISYIQHYTNRLKYSASNIPTFSRRESNLLPSTPHIFTLQPTFKVHNTSIIILQSHAYITYLYNKTACLLFSRDNFPTKIPIPFPLFPLGTKYIYYAFFLIFFFPFFSNL